MEGLRPLVALVASAAHCQFQLSQWAWVLQTTDTSETFYIAWGIRVYNASTYTGVAPTPACIAPVPAAFNRDTADGKRLVMFLATAITLNSRRHHMRAAVPRDLDALAERVSAKCRAVFRKRDDHGWILESSSTRWLGLTVAQGRVELVRCHDGSSAVVCSIQHPLALDDSVTAGLAVALLVTGINLWRSDPPPAPLPSPSAPEPMCTFCHFDRMNCLCEDPRRVYSHPTLVDDDDMV